MSHSDSMQATGAEGYPTLDPLTFPLTGVRLIEASAGTGKTYAIANLFARLVAERGLSVDRILVVTFTRAATEELRGRVRQRLRQALAVLQNGGGDDAFLLALRTRCGAEGSERLNAALLAMDEAAIHTIHGFCQRLLMDHAFESGSGFEAELVNDDADYRTQAMRDFWRRRCYPLAPEPAAWVFERWPTPDHLLRSLKDAFAYHRLRLLPETRPDLDAVRAGLLPLHAEMASLWRGQRDAIIELLVQDKALGHAEKTYRRDRVETAAAELDVYLDADAALLNPPPGLALFSRSALLEGRTAGAIKKGLAPPEHPLFDLCQRIHRTVAGLRRDFLVALQVEALSWCREEIRKRKSAANVLAPDDLLLGAHRALQGPGAERLAQCVRRAWPVALIDEFQDTDPLQYEIFQRVYADAPDSGLVMIGDPKQAIYGFRGADLLTYLAAARGVAPQAGHHSLDTNWRSAGHLVEAVNALFSEGNPFLLDAALAYRPVRSAGRADQRPLRVAGDSSAALHLWQLRATEENTYRGVIKAGWAEPVVADACAAEIARLLTLGRDGGATLGDAPLQARDIAVLVRDRKDAALVRDALWGRGVGSAFISRDSVFDSAEAAWLLPLLEAVADEGGERSLRRALAGPILGWDASRLERLNRDELLLEAVQARFHDYARRWQRQGVTPMLNRLLHGEGVPARLLFRPDGERALTNLRHLGELLQAAAREVHGGPRGLLRWYRDRLAAGGDSEEAQLRLESDENLVQVVTLHKSKGLQYPLVFLPYPWRNRPYTANSPRLAFHDSQGRMTLDLGSDAFDEHLPLAERERLAEDMRLLYVALTRAQHRVYCVWGNIHGAATSALAHLLHGQGRDSWLHGEAPHLDDDLIADRLALLCGEHPAGFTRVRLPTDPSARFQAGPRTQLRGGLPRFHRILGDDWRVTSYSAFIAGHQDLPERPDFDALAVPAETLADEPATPVRKGHSRFDFPRGMRAGQCLHGILERMDLQSGDSPQLRDLVRHQLKRQGLEAIWEDCVARWLLEVLSTSLDAAPGFTLADVAESRRLAEMGFYLPLAPLQATRLQDLLSGYRKGAAPQLAFGRVQGMLNGFIDLVLERQGRYYVLDYKSNYLGSAYRDYAPESMRLAMHEHLYDLQYLIYSVALHRYLRTRLPDYRYERHFGGVYYLFLRGMAPARPGSGVYRARPPLAVIEALDRLFGETPGVNP